MHESHKLVPGWLIGGLLFSEERGKMSLTRNANKTNGFVAKTHFHFGSAVDHNRYFLSNLADGAQLSGGGTCNLATDEGYDAAAFRVGLVSSLVSRPETTVGIFTETN